MALPAPSSQLVTTLIISAVYFAGRVGVDDRHAVAKCAEVTLSLVVWFAQLSNCRCAVGVCWWVVRARVVHAAARGKQ